MLGQKLYNFVDTLPNGLQGLIDFNFRDDTAFAMNGKKLFLSSIVDDKYVRVESFSSLDGALQVPSQYVEDSGYAIVDGGEIVSIKKP